VDRSGGFEIGEGMRIGIHQLRLLVSLGSPCMHLIVLDRVAKTLLARGLIRESDSAGYVITPLGLRVLADEMAAGRVDCALTAMKKELDARRAAREETRRK
jgi:hypothetical protein